FGFSVIYCSGRTVIICYNSSFSTHFYSLLRRGSMFVVSSKQFASLLSIETGFQYDSLLDLGKILRIFSSTGSEPCPFVLFGVIWMCSFLFVKFRIFYHYTGAGDGMVTKHMAIFFRHVYATELSRPMRWRLHEHGFT
ncbi:hypothetical protein FBUS_06700, partial [Fasciolopsis buskii]